MKDEARNDEVADAQSQFAPRLLRLSAEDNIAVAATTIEAGQSLLLDGRTITFAARIPTGHKVAIVPIAAGEKVIKYGASIGSATAAIRPGEYVHTHNLKSDYLPTYTLDGSHPYLRD
jgi:altronate dehydratase